MPLEGRFIQIAGSASPRVDAALLRRGHTAIRGIVTGILSARGGVIVGVGPDERRDPEDADSALLFDWDVLEQVYQFISRGDGAGPVGSPLARVITSPKNIQKIPAGRRGLW